MNFALKREEGREFKSNKELSPQGMEKLLYKERNGKSVVRRQVFPTDDFIIQHKKRKIKMKVWQVFGKKEQKRPNQSDSVLTWIQFNDYSPSAMGSSSSQQPQDSTTSK